MTAPDELSYIFVKPSPFTRAMLRFTGAMAVGGSATILALWGTGILSTFMAGFLGVYLLVAHLAMAISFLLQGRGMKRAILTPVGLQIEQRSAPWHDYPWQDIASVGLQTWKQRAPLNRLFGAMLFREVFNTPHVKIVLRRAIRFPQWGSSPISTRGWAVFVPGINTLRLYLQDPEGFVRDAQRFQQGAGPSGQ
jgi:hypothetical protein